MNNLPIYVSIVFGLTTFLTIWFFFKAINASMIAFGIIIFLSALQAILGFSGFYLNQNTIPPRLIFLILPSLILIIGLFTTQKGRQFIDSLDIKALTILHIVRIPVEIVLYWLFLAHTIPQLMTFEGRNFDILSGLTAPLVFYFGFVKQKLPKNALLIWNFICLALLFNIVITAILSAKTPFQKLAFDQPNIAVTYFPFVWLPSIIVPIVLFAHLVSIRQLLKK